MKRIHIVGLSPRTGTTLMAEAMKTGFSIGCYAAHEMRLWSRPKKRCNIFLTKVPKDIMTVGPSLSVDPDLYVICMIRDPRDIICSKHKKDPGRYWTSLKFWRLYSKMFDKLENHPRFIPIWYEAFVSNPDKVQAHLAKNIPFLEQKTPFSRYHKTASVSEGSEAALGSIRPIRPTSVGKWRKHKARLAGQLQLHGPITPNLIKYGYEKNNQWLRELDDIQPDLRPSHFSEYMSFKERQILKKGKYLEACRRVIEQKMGRRIRITRPKKWF
jgi:hypothetical protein